MKPQSKGLVMPLVRLIGKPLHAFPLLPAAQAPDVICGLGVVMVGPATPAAEARQRSRKLKEKLDESQSRAVPDE